MDNEKQETTEKKDNSDAAIKPDPETLNTTDPQEHMKGPLSSLVKGAEDSFDEDSEKDSKE